MSDRSLIDGARGLVRAVFDVSEGLNRSLLEAIYRLAFLIGALPWVVFTVLAFQRSNVVWGLVWAFILGPAVYVVLVTGMRIGIGFAVVSTRLMQELSEMPAAVDRLTAAVDNLHEDLGRLQSTVDRAQFWRAPGRRLRSSRYRDDDPVPTGDASGD